MLSNLQRDHQVEFTTKIQRQTEVTPHYMAGVDHEHRVRKVDLVHTCYRYATIGKGRQPGTHTATNV